MSEPIDEPGDFLPGYLAGDLSLEDERVMLASATTSQEFFNRLMEAEALRDALSSPEQRDRLRAALQAWEGRPQPNCAGDGGHDDEIDCVSFAGILVPSEIRCDLPQAVHPPSVDLGALEPGTLTHAQQGGERSLSAGARTFAIAATIIVCL